MAGIKAKAVAEVKRIYLDLSIASHQMLRQLAFDADIPKKRFLELLIEQEVKRKKK